MAVTITLYYNQTLFQEASGGSTRFRKNLIGKKQLLGQALIIPPVESGQNYWAVSTASDITGYLLFNTSNGGGETSKAVSAGVVEVLLDEWATPVLGQAGEVVSPNESIWVVGKYAGTPDAGKVPHITAKIYTRNNGTETLVSTRDFLLTTTKAERVGQLPNFSLTSSDRIVIKYYGVQKFIL